MAENGPFRNKTILGLVVNKESVLIETSASALNRGSEWNLIGVPSALVVH